METIDLDPRVIRLTVTLGSAGASEIDEDVVGTEMAFDYGYMIHHPGEEGDHLDLPLGGVGAREDRNVMVTVLTGVCLGHGGQLKRGLIICSMAIGREGEEVL